ncbi:MAG: diguanylate cyclase [Gemmatimonadota bacterium]|nr:MAG: diguanylate cyclase [Gemmatimonadota bacterium]
MIGRLDPDPGTTVRMNGVSVTVDQLPGRLPPKALVISCLSLVAAATASLLWPEGVAQYSALVWLLAIVPAFLFAYYKGWRGATIALVLAMILLAALEVGFSTMRGGEVAWWIVGSVTVVLISVSMGAGLVSEAHRRETAEALKLAYADPLTGIPNRRVLQLFLSREFAATNRGRPFAIVVLDVDRFKTINDTAGHHAGDAVLRAVAEALDDNTRRSDLSGRLGGDEFLALLPGAGVRGALTFAERVRLAVAERFEGFVVPVTISCGVAVSNSNMKTQDDLWQAADVALYGAKREGGDRTVVAGPQAMKGQEIRGANPAEGALAS